MEDNFLKKIEHTLVAIFLILGLIAIVTVVILICTSNNQDKNITGMTETKGEETTYDWEAGLSDSTIWMPDELGLYEQMPALSVEDRDEKKVTLNQFQNNPTVITFFASWCGDCKEQMPKMQEYIEKSKKYGDITFIMIDKTDGEKETKESGETYFESLGLDADLYFDTGLSTYNEFGMHNVPSTIFIDSMGKIAAICPKQITDSDVFEAYLERACKGTNFATQQFICNNLLDDEGGVHSEYQKDAGQTYQSDVLSESEGLLLQYAVSTENRELYQKVYSYIENHFNSKGLFPWKVSKSEKTQVNALIDDLRIYNAIEGAKQKWNTKDSLLSVYCDNLLKYGTDNGQFVDYYDPKTKTYANRFTLCYADFLTMDKLAKEDELFKGPCDKAKDIVLNGQISDTFPMFYSYYDYEKKKYDTCDLNMAEAMITLLHLSESHLLPDASLEWIEKEISEGGVKARYTVKGDVVNGYEYESTAVYATIAMIALEEKDEMLFRQAVNKMEKMRINDKSLEYNGAFGLTDGTGITSFDQLMPLTTYAKVYY